MKIDKNLNFVVPIYGEVKVKTDAAGKPEIGEDGRPVVVQPVEAYVHSTPLAVETIDKYFLILGQTFSQIFNLGLGAAAGPGMAMRLLRKLATSNDTWEDAGGELGVKNGLVEEIRRRTMVIARGERGWEPLPLQVAVDQNRLSAEDKAEVENAIVFFICVSATLNRDQRRRMLEAAAGLWNAQLSSSSSTDFAASLPTSTATGSFGATSPAIAASDGAAANAMVDGKPSSVPR